MICIMYDVVSYYLFYLSISCETLSNVLKEVVEGLEVSVTQVRGDIVRNKVDIDELALDVSEEREALKIEFDGKIATLEEELEQLATSLERGSWTFTLNSNPGPGEYTMIKAFLDEDAQEDLCSQAYAQCSAAAGGDPTALAACNREYQACNDAIDGSRIVTTDDWTECDELVFNDVDMNGVVHGWAGIDSDHYIDVFNMNDANYMVGDIATHGGGTFGFDLISSKGSAAGPATVKIFKSEGTVDFDQYVRKTGGTIVGTITILPDKAARALELQAGPEAAGTPYNIFTVRNSSGDLLFYIDERGAISAAKNDYRPTGFNHLANKKYVDDAIAALKR